MGTVETASQDLLRIDGEGVSVTRLLHAGADGRLGVARTDGPARIATAGAVAWVVVEGGSGSIRIDDDEPRAVDGRDDVFTGPGWSALLGPASTAVLAGDVRATVVWRAEMRPMPSRVIDPASVPDEVRGAGTTLRTVRTYVDGGPLIVGETLNPPGLWSSYPPHRHEHEEIYLYRFDPPTGFGMQMRSESDDDERAVVVRDGRIERITSGWHPVAAAPGSTLYYLWALAGADTLDTEVDSRYA